MAKKSSGPVYPLSALRATALHTQLLTTPNDASPAPTLDMFVDLVKALGYVQIDTLHVVNRAHYINLWARFGIYDIADFHKLIYTANQRKLYEGWGHAASIIPLYPFISNEMGLPEKQSHPFFPVRGEPYGMVTVKI